MSPIRLDRILYVCIGCFFITVFILFSLGVIISFVPSVLDKPQQSRVKVQASQDLIDYAKEKEKETWVKFEKELDITIPENERENFYQTIKVVEEDNTISQKTKEEVIEHLIERYKN